MLRGTFCHAVRMALWRIGNHGWFDRKDMERRRNGNCRNLRVQRLCQRDAMLDRLVRQARPIGRDQDVFVHCVPVFAIAAGSDSECTSPTGHGCLYTVVVARR